MSESVGSESVARRRDAAAYFKGNEDRRNVLLSICGVAVWNPDIDLYKRYIVYRISFNIPSGQCQWVGYAPKYNVGTKSIGQSCKMLRIIMTGDWVSSGQRTNPGLLGKWPLTQSMCVSKYHINHIISYHIIVLKQHNHLKVGTDKPKLKVKMQSVSYDDVRKKLLEKLAVKGVLTLGRCYIFWQGVPALRASN